MKFIGVNTPIPPNGLKVVIRFLSQDDCSGKRKIFGPVLPPHVSAWYGFNCNDPIVGGIKLSRRNDVFKESLEEIANLIEKEYL